MPAITDEWQQGDAIRVRVMKENIHPSIAAKITVVNMGIDFKNIQYVDIVVKPDEVIWPIRVVVAWNRWSIEPKSGVRRGFPRVVHIDMAQVYPTLYMRSGM